MTELSAQGLELTSGIGISAMFIAFSNQEMVGLNLEKFKVFQFGMMIVCHQTHCLLEFLPL